MNSEQRREDREKLRILKALFRSGTHPLTDEYPTDAIEPWELTTKGG